jgi:hypothetical protein
MGLDAGRFPMEWLEARSEDRKLDSVTGKPHLLELGIGDLLPNPSSLGTKYRLRGCPVYADDSIGNTCTKHSGHTKYLTKCGFGIGWMRLGAGVLSTQYLMDCCA